ncbi:hypothetical protein GX51_02591 [Blastomyces parvus]|uniref:Fungal calcium binding protein domain-containing protein n=1 Tax=Blastomyces parvus TaxID=2060905 RepID=A0A2B7XAT9_9EURO|nr:hypothetical protein GX51_02591 [Blastomyces parvus]
MKLSTIIAPLMLVAAAASGPLESSETKLALRDYDVAVNQVRATAKAAGCNWISCVKSLARYNAICAMAAAHRGLRSRISMGMRIV